MTKEIELYKTGQRIFVAEKVVLKLMNYFVKNKYWFHYQFVHKRHEFVVSVDMDLIKDITAKLNNYVTSEHS